MSEPKPSAAYLRAKALADEIIRQRRKEKCENSFRDFVENAWKIVEPGVPFVGGVHVDAICEHLQALADGEAPLRQLIINVPPRHGKSTLCAVMFPAWVWIKHPEKKFLYASYAENLSLRDSRKCRLLIRSSWYQSNWGQNFKIVSDQNEKRRFENDKTGYRLATSVGGSNTGEGGDYIIYDDANNMSEINSDIIRTAANDWHDQTMVTRLNDPKTGIRINIQQRGHQDDMTGHLFDKEKGKWDHLVLPAEFEGALPPTSIGWVDPRTHIGELLCPERFGPIELEDLKRSLGPIGTAGQLQQRPSPATGSIFQRQSWNYWNPIGTDTTPVAVKNPGESPIFKTPVQIPAAFEQIVQSYDFAFKDEAHNDFVAGHVWGRVGANVYLLKRKTERLSFPDSVRLVREFSEEYPCPEKLVEGKANGPAVIATLRNEIPGLIDINPEGGKESRAHAVAPYVEAGNVFLPNPDLYPWVREMIEEFAFFPRAKHDDDVDAATQALRRLFDSVSQNALPEFRVAPRPNEPNSACHIKPDHELQAELHPHWRRWVAVQPAGAALWMCETPRGALRVYRELDLTGIDAHETGRLITQHSLPDIRAFMNTVHSTAKWNIDILLAKEAFVPVEPIGSYAELMEQGIYSYEPTDGPFDQRVQIKQELKQAKFSTQMAEVEDAAFDRLRELLRFKPVDFEPVAWDREKAIALSKADINRFGEYMAAVEGQTYGDFPKVKFGAPLANTIASIGTVKKNEDIVNPFMLALLIGVCAPRSIMSAKAEVPRPWNPHKLQRVV